MRLAARLIVFLAQLELFNATVKRDFMVFHDLGQVVQFVDFDLDVEPEAYLILILRLQGEKLKV